MQTSPSSADATANAAPAPALAPQAYRCVAATAGPEGALARTLDLVEPRKLTIAFHPLDVEEALKPREGTPPYGEPLLEIVHLPTGHPASFDLQRRADAWLAERNSSRRALFDIPYRSDRLLWRPGRAVCLGSGEFRQDELDALAYFSLCESELSGLERRLRASWPDVERDLDLVHGVGSEEAERQTVVNARTRDAYAMRIGLVRLELAFERYPEALSAPAQRIVGELAQQADAANRLRLIDNGIEVLEDVYDTANDRLTEFRYFRNEYRVEIAIAVLLLVEVVLLLVQIWTG